MSKIKQTLRDKKLYCFLIITMMFLGMFIRMNFSTDTYYIADTDPESIVKNFLVSGRFITAIFFRLLTILKMDINIISFISFVIAIICITLSLYKLYNIIKEDIKNEILCILLSTIIIINPFVIEFFMFIERGIFAFAILMCICALGRFINFLKDNKNRKNFYIAMAYMLIATFSYQGIVAIFVALGAIYTVKYSKSIKEFFINTILMLTCYGIPVIINFAIIRVFFSNSRVSGNIILSESIDKIKSGVYSMLGTYKILHNKLFCLLIIAVTLLFIITIILRKDKVKDKFISILSYLYICGITTFMAILPVIMQDTASIWFVPRSTYAFGSMVGILMLITLETENINTKKTLETTSVSKIITSTIIVISIILLAVQFKRFNIIELDFYKTNYLDKVNSLQIGNMIQEYEKSAGIKITKISIYQDESKLYAYEGIFSSGDINVTGFSTDWSDVSMINYYNNIKLEKIPNSQEIKEKFKGKNWNNFSNEQIIFENDTIHFCKF